MAGVAPRATYRLQLTPSLGLADAAALAPYLARLGVSHLYASPILAARAGSTHGYDVVDPRRVNAQLGGEPARIALVRALRVHDLGLVLDIVPNHVAASSENAIWEDLLAHGHGSRYAHWFDVRWHLHPRLARPRLVLPVLGAPLTEVIARGELRVVRVEGRHRLAYWDRSWPIDPATESLVGGSLRALVDAQHYALVWWRRGARHGNYRRFFDVDDLVGVRQEDPRVFAATHERVLDWVAAGEVEGLRVDHVDGLADPTGYLERLVRETASRRAGAPLPVWVEKILASGERLPREWPVAGTTGYEFAREIDDVMLDPEGAARIREAWLALVGRDAPGARFDDVAFRAKLESLERAFAGEARRLGRLAHDILRRARDAPSRAACARAVQLLAAALRVYRTYRRAIDEPPRSDDRLVLARALAGAVRHEPSAAPAVRALAALLGETWRPIGPARRADRVRERLERGELLRRFQQLTGAAAAKGVEDTAFYRWVPLASRDEVGGDPGAPLAGASARLHESAVARARDAPLALLAVSTHDTKRSADLRARLAVLSEMPDAWTGFASRWLGRLASRRVRSGRRLVPDANALYLLLQTLVGLWPDASGAGEREALCARVRAYMRKAAREAKRRTSWTDEDVVYERALDAIVELLVLDRRGARFRTDLRALARRVTLPGWWNALARTAVQLTAPGIPDLYQGDELWNLSVVDPDNRRPVDFARRARVLESLERDEVRLGRGALCDRLLADATDGRIKLQLVRTLLALRRAEEALFARGDYRPIEASGIGARHALAFVRTHAGRALLVIVARRTVALGGAHRPPIGGVWDDAALLLPDDLASRRWTDVCRGTEHAALGERASLARLLARWPIAVLTGA